ncbi:MAG: deoxyribodipyrimidine photo-lyase [Thermoanaerobaculia bacterium]
MDFRALLGQPQPVDLYDRRVSRNNAPENSRGEFVLYWVQSARRMSANIALNYAIAKANAARLPVVVYESLRSDYPSANDRIHTFVLEGVRANAAEAKRRGLRYLFFLPRTAKEARGVVRRLAARARLVVTDEFPTFVVRAHTRRIMEVAAVAVHAVDGNGILPMRAFDKEQYSAKVLRDRAARFFAGYWSPLKDVEPARVFKGEIDLDAYDGESPRRAAASCAIDHAVAPVTVTGGRPAAEKRLDEFVAQGDYAEKRNRSAQHTSGLSPYLHFGHIGIHEIVERVLRSDMTAEDVNSFLEEAIIRRELSFNLCFYRPDHDSLSALPDWATRTIDRHRRDRRSPRYSFDELEAAGTADEVWNLAQRQMLACGTMHGYLRMLWGKKIIEWSATPEEALASMILLFEKYSLDGRDPNTYAGVLWCFGKHDRAWFPERPIFGTLRYMSSDSTARKVRLAEIEALVTECEASARIRAAF